VLTLRRLSFVTTNVSGLMIPAKPASIANDPPMINKIPAKLIQPTAAPLGSVLDTRAPVGVGSSRVTSLCVGSVLVDMTPPLCADP
jgi:hypothetical protein